MATILMAKVSNGDLSSKTSSKRFVPVSAITGGITAAPNRKFPAVKVALSVPGPGFASMCVRVVHPWVLRMIVTRAAIDLRCIGASMKNGADLAVKSQRLDREP